MAYPTVPGVQPLAGDSPAIDAATYPDGTPLSLTPVYGKSFTLIGRHADGSDNAAVVQIGTEVDQPLPLEPGKDEYIGLNMQGTNDYINLQDFYVTGTDGDGVKWLRIG